MLVVCQNYPLPIFGKHDDCLVSQNALTYQAISTVSAVPDDVKLTEYHYNHLNLSIWHVVRSMLCFVPLAGSPVLQSPLGVGLSTRLEQWNK